MSSTRSIRRVDILVNNAGFPCESLLEDISVEDWDQRWIDTNLRGTFLCTRMLIGQILESRRWQDHQRRVAARPDRRNRRSALRHPKRRRASSGLTKALAREVAGRDVLVNAIAPGPIETPLLDRGD
jgi:3-oxoacyl-[acyl-carrier protein] reductase